MPLGIEKKDAPRRPTVRFISASKAALKKTSLRIDLAHRLLSGDIIRVPSLTERKEDIPGLLEAFLVQANSDYKTKARFSSGAIKALQSAAWPGELRELRSLIEATVRTCVDRAQDARAIVVHEDDVRQRIEDLRHAFGDADVDDDPRAFDDDVDDTAVNLRLRSRETQLWTIPVATAVASVPSGVPAMASASVNPRKVTEGEIRAALAATDGNIEHATTRLGIARRTLMKKMDEFGIERPHKKT